MKFHKLTVPLLLSISLGMLSACSEKSVIQPALSLDPQVSSGSQTLSKSAQTRFVRFQVDPSQAGFAVKQTAQANYIKLTAVNGAQTVYDSRADAQGFVQVVNAATPFSLGAQIPDGNNWVVTVGFYSNKTSPPILELKNAFHVPLTGTVSVSMQTHLTGAIVEELHKMSSTILNTALDLNAYQSFVNGLTGATVTNNVLSFTRLTSLNPATPQALSPRALALEINKGTIAAVNNTTGSGLTPTNYQLTPFAFARYVMTSGTYGADQAVALNANNGWAFFNDALDGNTASEKVYGLSASTTLDAASGLKNFTANFNPLTGHQIMNPEIVLGATNPTGNSEKASLFYLDIEQVGSSNTGRVHALDQSNATEIWSYTFPFSINNYGSSDKVHAPLLLWRDQGVNPSCKCDDEDFVYTYINADSTHSGIYALKQARAGGAGTAADGITGSQVWFYNLPNNSITVSGGAVSKDGSKLYFVTNSSTASDLIILNRSDGSLVQTVSLGSGARVSPVIGTDGTVYVLSTSTSNSRLKAFNPDGSVKWTTDVNFGNVPFSHAPIVDRQNNKDVIYLISNKDQTTPSAQNAFIYAYWEDGTAKWTSPFRVTTSTENKVYAGLLVGAELDGSRLLYTGLSNAKLYAIRDKGTQGQLEWETSPGGTLWNGLNLRNGLLYVSTVDGGDRQFVLMHALKVSTPNVPASAPWPKTGGNLRNSGVSHTVDPEASNLRANSVS